MNKKTKIEFLKACFPTMVSRAYTNVDGEFVKIDYESSIDLVLLGQFVKTLRVGGMSDYFDKFIIDYINNDSDLLYRENVLKSKIKTKETIKCITQANKTYPAPQEI